MAAKVRLGVTLALALLGVGCARGVSTPYAGFVDEPVAAVAAQLAGRVESIPVREGERVRKGQLLARLDSATFEGAVAEAEANLERSMVGVEEAEANLEAVAPTEAGAGADISRAKATYDQAKLEFDRAQALADAAAATKADLDLARSRMLEAHAALASMITQKAQARGRVAAASASTKSARAAVRVNEAALRIARAQLAQTRVLSPFDGVVVSRNLEEGEWAAPGTPIVTVEDTSHPWVRLDVEETSFARLRLGRAAEVHVVALPSKTLRGRVALIGAEGDFALDRDVKRGRPDVRTFLVRVAIDDPPPELRPGMTAEVRLLEELAPEPSARQAQR